MKEDLLKKIIVPEESISGRSSEGVNNIVNRLTDMLTEEAFPIKTDIY